MGIWAWIQPVDRIWKVVSDAENGILQVYNEKSELILEQKGLRKEEVSFIENNFLKIVAMSLNTDKVEPVPVVNVPRREHNYMYA